MAAGPAAEEASHAPNNQPEPIKLPSPNNTSWTRLILPSLLFLSHKYSFYVVLIFIKNDTL